MIISRRITTGAVKERIGAQGERYRPEAIVLHLSSASMTQLKEHYTQTPAEKSMHFVIGRNGMVHQYIEELDLAQHIEQTTNAAWPQLKADVDANNYTISIQIAEMNNAPLGESIYNVSGQLVRAICERWGIPVDREHIIASREIDDVQALIGEELDLDRLVQMIASRRMGRHPIGKGMFVWRLKPVMQLLNVDTEGLAESAQALGLSWLVIKGAHRTNQENADLLPQVVPALRKAGIGVWLYQRMYGEPGEVDTALQCLDRYEPDGWFLDAEEEYKGKYTQATAYMQKIRERYPVLPIGLCSYRFPSFHRTLPWREFLESCDFHAPQVYWHGSTTRFGSPAAQLKRSVDELTGAFPTFPDLFDFKDLAVVPVGSAYREHDRQPTTAEIDEFDEAVKAMQLPGLCWFRWEHVEKLGFHPIITRHKWSIPLGKQDDEIISDESDPGDDQAAEPETDPITYVVRPGDNLFRIARAYGTTVEILAEFNGITNVNLILVGQVIRIPAVGSNNGGSGASVASDKFEIVDIVNDLHKHSTLRYPTRTLDEIQNFVVHHTATHADTLVQTVSRFHVQTQKWAGIGYSLYVTKDGSIYQTNHLTTVSRAASGRDRPSLNVCLPGIFMNGARPTDAQIAALRWLFHEWVPSKLGRKLKLVGHYELGSTLCPGDSWHIWCKQIDFNKIVDPLRVAKVHPDVA